MSTISMTDKIFCFIRGYCTRDTTLPRLCDLLLRALADEGYHAEITESHRNNRVIRVDDHHFRIIRNADWLSFDVRPVD